jgi:hypothetical protein
MKAETEKLDKKGVPTFTGRPVMVHTGLPVERGVHGGALPKKDISALLQSNHLPFFFKKKKILNSIKVLIINLQLILISIIV